MTTDDLRQALDLLDDRTASDGEHAVARQVITAQVAALTAERDGLLTDLIHFAQTNHQAHHAGHSGTWLSCDRGSCPGLRRAVSRARGDTTPPAGAQADIPARPTIVCLCGSTRFWRTFQQASLQETLAGRIVLSIGAASGTDDEHFGNLPRDEYNRVKEQLDQLHLRKVEMADEVLILNVGAYVGESTRRELNHARQLGKRVRWWEPAGAQEHEHDWQPAGFTPHPASGGLMPTDQCRVCGAVRYPYSPDVQP